jgi:L-alanine-DL-glutamate epimerase-like enolase superfamily enzyme
MANCGPGAPTARIACIESFVVAYPIKGYFKFFSSTPGTHPVRTCVVVKVQDEMGRVGWGQSVPAPTWSYETVESVRTTIDRYLAPALVGCDAFDEASLEALMDRTIAPSFSRGQPVCKAGIELAVFDLTGRILGQSAAQRWRRTARDRVTLSWTLNPRSLDELAASVVQAHDRGFHNFNVKVGQDPEFDVAVCGELRRLAPNAFVWVDANGGYDLDQALAVGPRFADQGIAAFEQPLPSNRLSWYRRLRQQGSLPILLDEPIISAVDLAEFHQLGLCDGVAMKVARCGGLRESCKVMDYVEENGLLFFASGLTDADLSLAASLLLFAAYDLERPAALNAPQYLEGSLLADPIHVHGDQALVPRGPGLGVEVDEEKLVSIRVRTV